MRRHGVLLICAATLLGAACSDGPDAVAGTDAPAPRGDAAPAEACDQAFADAVAGDADLEAALTSCEDIAAFTDASTTHPEALGDVEPQVWLAEACTQASDPAVTESALCIEVAGG